MSDEINKKRIAIFIVTFNAVNTLRKVLDRIPTEMWEKVEEVFVFDDSSQDDTYLIGLGYKEQHKLSKLKIFRHTKNEGYGGNQILGYQYAIEQNFDIVVLLHGDGQYAPEVLPSLLAPLEKNEADAVFGSRMLDSGKALKGGMPLYKYVGNKILTTFENALLGTSLSEFHSGYRLYSCSALKKIPFKKNSQDFHFDTQIIIQFVSAGLRIVEKPIPTYYGDEVCYVNGLKYAKNVFLSVLKYKLHQWEIKTYPEYQIAKTTYKVKKSPYASHARILKLISSYPQKMLDVGCGTGELGNHLTQLGHEVIGIDYYPPEFSLSKFYKTDLEKELPRFSEKEFNLIIMADVLEHLPRPEKILNSLSKTLADEGRIIVSLPNVVHWYVRLQILIGRFEYTNKGILDSTHLRFFTRASAKRMFENEGFEILQQITTPIPWENIFSPKKNNWFARFLTKMDYFFTRLCPNMFAYQYIFELRKKTE